MWSVMLAPFATRGTAEWWPAQWGLMRSWLVRRGPRALHASDPLAARHLFLLSLGATDGRGRRRRRLPSRSYQRGGRWAAKGRQAVDRGEFKMCAGTFYCCANFRCSYVFREYSKTDSIDQW